MIPTLIDTITSSTFDNFTGVIQILTRYNITPPRITELFISNSVGSSNSVIFEENELIIIFNSAFGIIVTINSSGEIIIIGADADNYSINSDGELIYTF